MLYIVWVCLFICFVVVAGVCLFVVFFFGGVGVGGWLGGGGGVCFIF